MTVMAAAFGFSAIFATGAPAAAQLLHSRVALGVPILQQGLQTEVGWRGRRYHRHWRHWHRRNHHHHWGAGAGVAAGLAAGALIGGALAAQNSARLNAAIQYCIDRYRSYDIATRTYLGYDGLRHPCP